MCESETVLLRLTGFQLLVFWWGEMPNGGFYVGSVSSDYVYGLGIVFKSSFIRMDF